MNGLKEINDSHGHATGDRLIVGAYQCVRKAFGERGPEKQCLTIHPVWIIMVLKTAWR
ncbi:MAG: hypothetical protein IJ646_01375 [Clostridia bacterium]|nr:hypothetical protein [Clostridia bacterium]